ncbi:hypothetical protein E2C01_081539 [Portunus trituberculatus]|uniref:Uncharacterized protein n=1 Tax=Portunus trituberculatus TaxID=210409 RepID=A0A5B7IWM4_PORTR|nr:hypothetical protein [Portunus trituberculatus]
MVSEDERQRGLGEWWCAGRGGPEFSSGSADGESNAGEQVTTLPPCLTHLALHPCPPCVACQPPLCLF